MRVVSVNIGLPRTVDWHGREVSTGIFKEPVSGPVLLRKLNFDGDRQADLTVHGGEDKAVYAYPVEHYAHWRTELPGVDFPWGKFGENLTLEGLGNEASIRIGDRFRVGAAELEVTQPRLPCYKLGIRFADDHMVKRFLASRRTGFYFRVLQEGQVAAGDPVEHIARGASDVMVADVTRLYLKEKTAPGLLDRAIANPALSPGWRDYFREQLAAAAQKR